MARKVNVRPDFLKKNAHYLVQYAQNLSIWSLKTIALTPQEERELLAQTFFDVQREIEKTIIECLTLAGEEESHIKKVIESIKTDESKAMADKVLVEKIKDNIKPKNIFKILTDKLLIKIARA